MPEFDTLFALAEIAVGLAGFSAIVVLFKQRDSGKWFAADADRFHGMVLHAMAAALFCVLPSLVAVFVDDPASVWRWSSAVLGLQVAGHAATVVALSSTGPFGRLVTIVGGASVAMLLCANVLGLGFAQEFGPYLVGVAWHLAHAGVLFVMLVWVPDISIDR